LLEILINSVHAWTFDFIHLPIIFIYKRLHVSSLFIDSGCRKHGSSKGSVILFGQASYELHVLCLCRYLATRFRPVKMGDLVMTYATACLILYLCSHMHNSWAAQLQATEKLHYKNTISKIHPLCSNLIHEEKPRKHKL
jgi:hypothetical protein